MAGTLEKSTIVMESMGKLLKIPEISNVVQNLSKGKFNLILNFHLTIKFRNDEGWCNRRNGE